MTKNPASKKVFTLSVVGTLLIVIVIAIAVVSPIYGQNKGIVTENKIVSSGVNIDLENSLNIMNNYNRTSNFSYPTGMISQQEAHKIYLVSLIPLALGIYLLERSFIYKLRSGFRFQTHNSFELNEKVLLNEPIIID